MTRCFSTSIALGIALLAGSFMPDVAHASTEGPHCPLIRTEAAPKLRAAIPPASERLAKLHAFLQRNTTDRFPYVADPSSNSTWFVCNHFATQMFLRTSAFATTENFPDIQSRTPIRFSKDRLPVGDLLPTFYVHLLNAGRGFSHAINAIYLGSDPRGYDENFANYAFFEPQTDQFIHPGEYVKRYFPDLTTSTEVSISISETMGRTDSGEVQYITKSLLTFSCPASR